MKLTELFNTLNRLGLAHQVHLRENEQIVFYHWNRAMSDLVPSVTLQRGKIEKAHYPRTVMPRIYLMMNYDFENDFVLSEHKFVRDKRGK